MKVSHRLNITNEGEPQIKYCLKILGTLEFEMWCNNKKANYCAVKESILLNILFDGL